MIICISEKSRIRAQEWPTFFSPLSSLISTASLVTLRQAIYHVCMCCVVTKHVTVQTQIADTGICATSQDATMLHLYIRSSLEGVLESLLKSLDKNRKPLHHFAAVMGRKWRAECQTQSMHETNVHGWRTVIGQLIRNERNGLAKSSGRDRQHAGCGQNVNFQRKNGS